MLLLTQLLVYGEILDVKEDPYLWLEEMNPIVGRERGRVTTIWENPFGRVEHLLRAVIETNQRYTYLVLKEARTNRDLLLFHVFGKLFEFFCFLDFGTVKPPFQHLELRFGLVHVVEHL